MDLGKPISDTPSYNPDAAPRGGFDQGEHGRGTGLAGGHGTATSQNTQAGRLAQEDGFNAGLGGQHASGAIPSGTPIADKYTGSGGVGSGNTPDPYGQSGSGGLAGEKLDNSLDNFSGERGAGQGYGGGEAVSGSYAGGGTRDALSGQTGHTTGAGVGVLGENLGSGTGTGHHHHHHHHHEHGARDAALAGTAGAAAGAAGGAGLVNKKEYESAYGTSDAGAASTKPLQRAEGVAGLGGNTVPGVGGIQGSGIGPNDSEGERYSTERRDPGYGNLGGDDQGLSSSGAGRGLAGAGAAAGVGVGAGAYGASQYEGQNQGQQTSGAGGKIAEGGLSGTGGQGVNEPGQGAGHFGRAKADNSTGQPLSDHKVLDTGNSHSLVFDEKTGKYEHRRDL